MTVSKEEIMKKATELRDALEQTEEVSFYRLAEERINANSKVATKVSKIKALQKEVVNLEHYQKMEAMRQTENQIENVRADIDSLPIVTEFRRAQEDANDLLQSITSEITTKVTEELEKDN
ncbi:RicAFT regulatory complex protein RicA family protein [Listeria ivanovii]|uniref:Putative YmcA protein n=1 Tax=Listeria ivanovii (strain ATCC BAA-678 / PAM 55) TaxID=881621 RepID=G2Z8E1_LISIP|nr:RicAFT regulatory complex protein RicA family protein [Listeria ivanovii]AHI55899.1 hypothetical protein AX25_07255 [Listeria ivanovii WSLC3009]AIS65337.1 hypothetical protein JL52_07120 [Listeria ivanovii subsp. ivanovii]MBC1759997.1 hypothetical protein [Listeria ivanovii]MBK3914505.1 hypothetical protein [Listeria ivanovii subsp. ivanovii]MBK3921597.1 hypothetical protein [Listeria ivanovii subsp. ivanovii]